MWVFFIETMCM